MKKVITTLVLVISSFLVMAQNHRYESLYKSDVPPETFPIESLIVGLVFAALFVGIVYGTFFIVKQQSVAVIERFGKFRKISHPGLGVKLPLIDRISDKLSMKVLDLKVQLETKTKDDVFVKITTEVMYQIIKGKEKEAAYELTNPKSQIDSYINDIIRAEVPAMTLDEAFSNKEQLSKKVKGDLEDSMKQYGFQIIRTLITDINPDGTVKESMNAINAAERRKKATQFEAEALLIKREGEGKAEASFKKLQGQGMADQRIELAKGIAASLKTIRDAGAGTEDANAIMLITQHYDTLQDLGKSKANLVLFDGSTGAGMRNYQEMVTSFKTLEHGNQMNAGGGDGKKE